MSVSAIVARHVQLGARGLLGVAKKGGAASGTPESTLCFPGVIAQPPFSTNAACSYELVFSASSGCWQHRRCLELVDADQRYRRNHGAIGGAVANVFAVLRASTAQPKPMASVATAPKRRLVGAAAAILPGTEQMWPATPPNWRGTTLPSDHGATNRG